jgi:dienelactone hydrolase
VLAAAVGANTVQGLGRTGQQPREQNETYDQTKGAGASASATFWLAGTSPLEHPEIIGEVGGDPGHAIDENQYKQVTDYFLRQIAATPAKREKLWQPDFSSIDAYRSSVRKHREQLTKKMLGVIRVSAQKPEITVLQEDGNMRVEDVIIPLDTDFRAQALLFRPKAGGARPAVIAIPPEDQAPEGFAGLRQSPAPAKWLTALLERNVVVAVPRMVERRGDHPICQKAAGKDRRWVLWRLGFLIGRPLVGLEVQQVLALHDFLASQPEIDTQRIGVLGKSQGGMTALYMAAVDERLTGATVLDYFQQREECWKEPVDRVLYGQLNEFGDAEVAALIAPRPLTIVSTSGGPVAAGSVNAEAARARRFYQGLRVGSKLVAMEPSDDALETGALQTAAMLGANEKGNPPALTLSISSDRVDKLQNNQFEMLYSYLRRLCVASDKVRKDYWRLNTTPPPERAQKAAQLRRELAELMGVIPSPNVPLRPRTLLVGETDKLLAYDVILDALPGVQAYGQLLVPRLVGGNVHTPLPALVCQHGFEGAPKFVTGFGTHVETNDLYYHRFAERLAERGYVVFAPYLSVPASTQRPAEIHRADLVNPLVRQAATLGMMRTSIELAKLHRVVDFLQTLPFVDANNIGYYGISYGGYSAVWMPPLEPRLKFTVISGFFCDLREMNTDDSHFGETYWSLPDEDFYNWNALNHFTHVEAVAAMWPRAVCIEHGQGDRVTPPEGHERAWKEVKEFADAWNVSDRIINDDYDGPHTIHGIGTFFFVDRWLRPERPAGRDYGCCDDGYCYKTIAPGLHGYVATSQETETYVTQLLDSDQNSLIRGRFYVSNSSPVFVGMALKLSRVGHPGDLVIRMGSREGTSNLAEARIHADDVYPQYDLWYEAKAKRPVKLDPTKLYFFEITAESARSPADCYTLYGPKPLGAKDFPSDFGLSFRTLVRKDE